MKFMFKPAMLMILGLGIVVSSCKKDDPEPPIVENPDDSYDIPETYSFTDSDGNNTVNFSGQTERLDMLSEMVTYMKTANTSGTALDAQTLKNMFANNSHTWQDINGVGLNASTKQLKNKCFELHQDQFEDWMDAIAAASQSTEEGSNGTAGVVVSGTKQYLFDENGFEHGQLIEKGLMGAVFYYQATSYYLSEGQIGAGVNNTDPADPNAGKYYTAMEHHWDEAFGYFGVPVDFPDTPSDRFWGKYSGSRDGLLNTNTRLMDAFLEGRAAISNDDMSEKDAQIAVIQAAWQDVCAGTAIHYLNAAKVNISDDAVRNHQLSEAYAFIWSLLYNEGGDFSQADVTEILNHLGSNFYTISISDIDAAIDHTSMLAGLEDVKNSL